MNQNESEFEHKLKLHTENYVMYPNNTVWLGLQKELHINNRTPSQKRYAVIALLAAGVILSNFFIHNNSLKNNTPQITKVDVKAINDISINTIIENKKVKKIEVVESNSNSLNNIKPSIIFEPKTNPPYNTNNIVIAPKKEFENTEVLAINQTIAIKEITDKYEEAPSAINIEETNKLKALLVVPAIINTNKLFGIVKKDNNTKVINNFEIKTTDVVKNEIGIVKNKDLQNVNTNIKIDKKVFAKNKSDGWHINAIIVPTMSNMRIKNIGAYGDLSNVKKYNYLKPKMGVELGVQMQYKKNRTSFLIGGQINAYGNKFTAYDANGLELTLSRSTLNLNSYTFDSSYSYLRTVGSKANGKEYKNNFLSVSMPIGVNFNVGSLSKNINFYVAGMAAPSLLLYADNYTMSANLKNYIKVPDVLRKWNVNGIISTYVEFGGKNMSFQLGPQLSYQLFSIYKNDYYIKESSRDLGMRFGIIKKF